MLEALTRCYDFFVLTWGFPKAFVSWAVVVVRRQVFALPRNRLLLRCSFRFYYHRHLKQFLDAQDTRGIPRKATQDPTMASPITLTTYRRGAPSPGSGGEVPQRSTLARISPDIIRRIDVTPHRINPSGVADPNSPSGSPQVPPVPLPTRPQVPFPLPSSMPGMAGANTVANLPRSQTRVSVSAQVRPATNEADFGGFPGPHDLLSRLVRRVFPNFHRGINRTLTMPRAHTLVPHNSLDATETRGPLTRVSYFSFRAVVGRNSEFHGLNEDQLNELGGIEYRALNTLLWVVPFVSGCVGSTVNDIAVDDFYSTTLAF